MATFYLTKLYNTFAPADEQAAELMEKLKGNVVYKCVITLQRNYKFHRKFFALINLAYESWEPDPVYYKGEEVAKNIDRFRKDITILAGFGEPRFNMNGEVRFEAKSISFAKMSTEEFEKLFSAIIGVILGRVLTNYDEETLRDTVDKILNFS